MKIVKWQIIWRKLGYVLMLRMSYMILDENNGVLSGATVSINEQNHDLRDDFFILELEVTGNDNI